MTANQTLVSILAGLGTFLVLTPLVLLIALPRRKGESRGDWFRRARNRVVALSLVVALAASAIGLVVATNLRFEAVQKLGARILGRGITWRGSRGMRVVEFEIAGGETMILLPDDMAAGDAVSGIVSADRSEPPRSAESVRRLAGWALAVGNDVSRFGDGIVAFRIPRAAVHVTLQVRDEDGKVVATADVPVRPTQAEVEEPVLPASCPKNNLFVIQGRFDGDLRNTDVIIAGERLKPWVESPRRIVLAGPKTIEGRASLAVTDGGWSDTEMTSVVGVSVMPRSVAVTRGQTVPVTVTVTGLAGAERGEPIVIDLDQWSDTQAATTTSWPVDPAQAVDGTATLVVPVTASADGTLRTLARLRNDASSTAAR